MFLSDSPWKTVDCPVGDQCDLLNCIFKHETPSAQRAWLNIPIGNNELNPSSKPLIPESTAPLALKQTSKSSHSPFVGTIVAAATPHRQISSNGASLPTSSATTPHGADMNKLPLAERPVSPPPLKKARIQDPATVKALPNPASTQEIKLYPRDVPQNPATFPTRVLYLKKLHEEMTRLNKLAVESNDEEAKLIRLTTAQVILLAVEEEEAAAKDASPPYATKLRLRMVELKKMDLDSWIAQRLNARAKEKAPDPSLPAQVNGERSLDTGLTPAQELTVLRKLIARQDGLEAHGYVTAPPSSEDIESARKGVDASNHYEKCERCQSRFQVFPDRRDEDGALTTGGPCTYHYGRIVRAEGDRVYSCCREPIGDSLGCVGAPTHVFKVYDPNRLALIMPFECTPDNAAASADEPVCFDCEMAFTTHGMELIRLTAISWPAKKILLDVLVRPLGHILDLNTRFSGVSADMYANALPYQPPPPPQSSPSTMDLDPSTALRIVPSPSAARALLFTLLTPSTPLLGHAIENDLNTTRIVHPCIIDTVILFPHDAGPLPNRRSLKSLAKQFLWRDIQTAGAAGHDSAEDTRATADMVLLKVKRKWNEMRRAGWSISDGDGKLLPPKAARGQQTTDDLSGEEETGKRKRKADEGLDYGAPDSPGR